MNNQNEVLIINKRVAIITAATSIVCLASVFIAGYLIGYRHATQGMADEVSRVSLADQVYAHAYTHFAQNKKESMEIPATVQQILDEPNVSEPLVAVPTTQPVVAAAHTAEMNTSEPSDLYYVPLIGFSGKNKKQAQAMIDRWQKKGITLSLKARSGKNNSTWYQVIIPPQSDYAIVNELARTITRQEHIQHFTVEKINTKKGVTA